jgi:hypothetical protein
VSQHIRVLEQFGDELERAVRRDDQADTARWHRPAVRFLRSVRRARLGDVATLLSVLLAVVIGIGAVLLLGQRRPGQPSPPERPDAVTTLPPLPFAQRRTVSVPLASFSDPTPMAAALRRAGVPAMVQLLPEGKDCTAPLAFEPVPHGELPASNPARNPRANPPIDSGGDSRHPTLTLHWIPANATLVIESIPRSNDVLMRWPIAEKGTGIQPPHERGIYVQWARGRVTPCSVIAATP